MYPICGNTSDSVIAKFTIWLHQRGISSAYMCGMYVQTGSHCN